MEDKLTLGVNLEVISAAIIAAGKSLKYGFYPYKRAYAFVNTGKIDAIYAYQDVIRYELTKMNMRDRLRYIEVSSQPNYVCVSKAIQNSEIIIKGINKGLRIIRGNGLYQQIWNKYFPKN